MTRSASRTERAVAEVASASDARRAAGAQDPLPGSADPVFARSAHASAGQPTSA